jgi:hypothetical protein
MALIKPITNPINGHEDNYWRVTVIHSDAPAQVAVIMLGGYKDANWRQNGGQPNQSREIIARGADFGALATAPAAGQTVFDVMAGAAYEFVRNKRRPIVGGVFDEDGGVTLQTGEHFPAASIVDGTVPSEFADAVNG